MKELTKTDDKSFKMLCDVWHYLDAASDCATGVFDAWTLIERGEYIIEGFVDENGNNDMNCVDDLTFDHILNYIRETEIWFEFAKKRIQELKKKGITHKDVQNIYQNTYKAK